MTSSGTYAFAPSNGELVLAAYERLQIYAPSLRQGHMAAARRELNLMFASWSNRQVNLWEVIRTQATLTESDPTIDINAKNITILDASIVLNYGEADESRRYITPVSRTQYLSFSNQLTEGVPTCYWFDRLISPTVTFWPVPDGGGPYTFDYFSVTQVQDANLAGGETPDVPYRWFDALVAGMAHRLARIFAPPLEAMRKTDADEAWGIAASQDIEPVPVTFAPGLGAYYRG